MKDAVLSIALELFYHHPNNHAQSGLQREVVLGQAFMGMEA